MDLTHRLIIIAASGLMLLVALFLFLRRRDMSHSTSRSPAFGGELIVTGEGEIVIDDVVSHSPEMFKHPHKYVTVEFDPHRHLSPPCAGHDVPDCLNWHLIIFRHPRHGNEELRLRISWKVNRTRAIVWAIKSPHH